MSDSLKQYEVLCQAEEILNKLNLLDETLKQKIEDEKTKLLPMALAL
jgi:hypothetical protein